MRLTTSMRESKVPQHMMVEPLLSRFSAFVTRKHLSRDLVQRILFVQGYGRKSLNEVMKRQNEGITNMLTLSALCVAAAVPAINLKWRYTKNGGMRFLRVYRLQVSWCVCKKGL